MPPQNQPNPNVYDASKIKSLSPREHVRMRPGMYFGGVDKAALHHLVWEVLDDTISEFENSVYNTITISLLPDKTICIADSGQGLVISDTEFGKSRIEFYMTEVGTGGRGLRDSEYIPRGGLHGLGISAINALSSFCQVEVKREGFLWRQTYSEGLPSSSLEQIRPLDAGESTGTSITFRPDFTIMEENDFDFELIAKRCQELAYLLPQLRFTLQDKREIEQEISYHYPQGLFEWVKAIAGEEKAISEALSIDYEANLQDRWDNAYMVKVHLALQWLESDKQQVASFVNTIETSDGGSHITGLIAALCKALEIPSWPKLKRGFIGIMHILHPDPQFESQTKIRLLNSDVYTALDEAIEALFAAHPEAKAAIQAHFQQV